jgi:hypothetical protein
LVSPGAQPPDEGRDAADPAGRPARPEEARGGPAGAEEPPLRLPVRASIYIDPDGTVHFGSLFAELVPVARELGGERQAAPEGTGAEAGPR